MDLVINKTKLAKQSTIEGFIVFELYDTYGFPLDLTSLIARENGLEVDEVGFNRELELQKTRSRAATAMETDDWIVPSRIALLEVLIHRLFSFLWYFYRLQ